MEIQNKPEKRQLLNKSTLKRITYQHKKQVESAPKLMGIQKCHKNKF